MTASEVTYSSFYLRRASADVAFRACHRRGWEPALRRAFGLWVVRVRIEAPLPAPALGRVPQRAVRIAGSAG